MAKISLSTKIRKYIEQNPTKKVAEIAKELQVKYQYVYVIKKKMERQAAVRAIEDSLIQIETPIQIEMLEPASDPVNHPAHYKYGGIETIDFIEAKELGYNLGNVVKYITRSDHKGNRKEDLLKAQWYLTREINSIK